MKAEWLSGKLATQLPKRSFSMACGACVVGAIMVMMRDGVPLSSHGVSMGAMPAYLISFIYLLSLSLGALFWVIIFHLTRAGWSVVIRRLLEHIMKNIGLIALLFLPIVFGMHYLYEWTHADVVMHDHLLQGKAPYLNTVFFLIRASGYFIIWIWLANRFFKQSVRQDQSGDPALTAYSQRQSTYGVLLYALTLTFASVDWIMSLTPHWYSTMFGVYFFSGSVLASLSLTSVMALILRRHGFLKSVITIEHYHDMGKLIYGFVIFWAYIGFSQYFLIWYANIPEETHFYLVRGDGYWAYVSCLLVIGHFLVPFVLFMSRHAKRHVVVHGCMAIWLLIMHAIDIFWLIMPTFFPDGYSLTVLDSAIFVGMGCLYIGLLWRGMRKTSLLAYQDPRLAESIAFENV